MDVIREDTVAALHRAMVVLREELEMKNKMITRLRRRKHTKPVKTCLETVRRSLEVRHYS